MDDYCFLSTSSPLPLKNITQYVTETLHEDGSNYVVWRKQFESILKSKDLYKFVTGDFKSPAEVVYSITPKSVNSDYKQWNRLNNFVNCCLLRTIDDTLAPNFFKMSIASQIWKFLEQKFFIRDVLLSQLESLKKGKSSITDYFVKIRSINDLLVEKGVVIDEEDLILHALDGLGDDYGQFVDGLVDYYGQLDISHLTLNDLFLKLLLHEKFLEIEALDSVSVSPYIECCSTQSCVSSVNVASLQTQSIATGGDEETIQSSLVSEFYPSCVDEIENTTKICQEILSIASSGSIEFAADKGNIKCEASDEVCVVNEMYNTTQVDSLNVGTCVNGVAAVSSLSACSDNDQTLSSYTSMNVDPISSVFSTSRNYASNELSDTTASSLIVKNPSPLQNYTSYSNVSGAGVHIGHLNKKVSADWKYEIKCEQTEATTKYSSVGDTSLNTALLFMFWSSASITAVGFQAALVCENDSQQIIPTVPPDTLITVAASTLTVLVHFQFASLNLSVLLTAQMQLLLQMARVPIWISLSFWRCTYDKFAATSPTTMAIDNFTETALLLLVLLQRLIILSRLILQQSLVLLLPMLMVLKCFWKASTANAVHNHKGCKKFQNKLFKLLNHCGLFHSAVLDSQASAEASA